MNNFRRHVIEMHRKVKKKCPYCDKHFPMSTLGRHIRAIHDDEKEFCQYCGKSYRKGNLEIHIKTVHMELNTFCNICDEEIPWSMRYIHRQKFHNNIGKPKVKETSMLNNQEKFLKSPFKSNSDVDEDAEVYSDLNLDDDIQLNGECEVKQVIVNGKNFSFSMNT